MAKESTGNSVIPQLALQYAIQTKTATDTPKEVIQAARKYEDYLRGDRDFNDRLNDILNIAIDIAKVWATSQTPPASATLDTLVARVTRVQP